ncbi:hypothetical protein FD755_011952 [Muntiacus reevesi]|uniref:Uncharacterized protein n=1 Tax=Muntiacus reevesi TaxID=9886 RepID=A0A5N3XUD0_MUNRE|nr:hypothetical protein FD755_011952 [Muntiacus reevesi]
MGFSRQEYWSGLSLSPPGDLPDPGMEPISLALAGGFFTTLPPGKRHLLYSSHVSVFVLSILYSPSPFNSMTPLQYFCLENYMDGGAWQATVHGVAKICENFFHQLHIQLGLNNCDKCKGPHSLKCLSLPALIEQGDGFSQVLKMQPLIQLQRVHQEVFSSCCRKPDVKPESLIAQIETTPAETSTRTTTDLVLRRKQTKDCPQRKWYPLRPKRINLDT